MRPVAAGQDQDPGRNAVNVKITSLTRRFGRSYAVAGVSLATGPGVFGLLGPNGAGKTSLLRMMATVIPPTSGTLRLLGRDPGSRGQRTQIRRRLGYLPQNLGYYPGFTVAEFVEYFALLKDMPPARYPRRRSCRGRAGRPGEQRPVEAADPVGRDAAPGRHRAGDREPARAAAAGRADSGA